MKWKSLDRYSFLASLSQASVLYFVPSAVAVLRNHHQTAPILIVNMFFGWTLVGWVAALAWSFSAQKKTA